MSRIISHDQKTMKPLLQAAILTVTLAGCAANKTVPTDHSRSEEDKLAPVNLSVTMGEYVSAQDAVLAQYISDSVRQSSPFLQVETDFNRWPHRVVIRAMRTGRMGITEMVGILVTSFSLGLIPMPVNDYFDVQIAVFYGPGLLQTYSYPTESHTMACLLFCSPTEGRKRAIQATLDQFYQDLEASRLLPKMGDLKQQMDHGRADTVL